MLFLIYFYSDIAWILSAYVLQFVAVLYASTDGTYIGQSFVFWKTPVLNVGGVVASMVTLVKPLQPLKALPPIDVIPLGIVILVRLVQL